MSIEFRVERTKRIRRQMDDVVRFWLEGLSVTLIAQRLSCRRDRVYWLLRALELMDSVAPGRPGVKRAPPKGYGARHLYSQRVPDIDRGVA